MILAWASPFKDTKHRMLSDTFDFSTHKLFKNKRTKNIDSTAVQRRLRNPTLSF